MNAGRRLLSVALVAGCVTAGGLSAPARADDTEVFFYLPPADSSDRPNVLFILDTGQSMGMPADALPDYDPEVSYEDEYGVSTGCDDDKLYFGFSPAADKPEPTHCDKDGLQSVTRDRFVCDVAQAGLDKEGKATTEKLIYYGTALFPSRWGILDRTQEGKWIECGLDSGIHADGSSNYDCSGGPPKSQCYPIDNADGAPWGKRGVKATPVASALSAAPSHTFYTANYIAYQAYLATLTPADGATRMEQLKSAMKNVLGSISGVNVALMRFSAQGADGKQTSGGMVIHHFSPVEDSVDTLIGILDGKICAAADCPNIMAPLGRRPLGETLYEAYRYYAGLSVDFGVGSNIGQSYPYPSVWPSWWDGDADPGRRPTFADIYNSPTKDQVCSSDNYIVLLTDGFTEQDRSSDGGKIGAAGTFPFWDSMIRGQAPSLMANGQCDQATYKMQPDPEDPLNLVPNYAAQIDPKGEDVTVADDAAIPGTPSGAASGSYCVDDLTDYMYSVGVSDVASTPIEKRIKVKTFTIGFDLDRLGEYGVAARSMLVEAAARGGGKYYDAKSQADIEAQMTNAVREILIENSSFTSPSVAVNSFNRTQNLNDLYFSVFKPAWTYRWLGNLKRYKLVPTAGPVCEPGKVCDPNDIWDAKDQDAVEIVQSGKDQGLLRFKESARSYWSDFDDGYFAEKGGAAGELKAPASRTIYSNLTKEFGTLGEELDDLRLPAKLALANQLLFQVDSSSALTGRPPIDDVIDWAYGLNPDGSARLTMGDPLHSKPAVVSYGGTPEKPDVTVFVTTNDGFLHAFNGGLDADGYVGGGERWSFIPRELLFRLERLYLNREVSQREYGLDSPIRTLRYDKNGDGKIVAGDGDRVILYFGMRRGGSHYFAVDVTDRNRPELLWRIGAADDNLSAGSEKYLPGIGQTWSVPTIARVNVKDFSYAGDNPLKWVLVFGGGYNTNHDRIGYLVDGDGARVFDTTGNRIYMVDAISGHKIWRAGPSSGDAGAQLKLAAMNNAIPAEVRVVDMSGDGYADRMYASDLGGQLWRFDIRNGSGALDLVTGGRIAALGNGDDPKPVGSTNSRRFFTAPDPSLITYQGETFVNIAIGSGHREKPVVDDQTHNRAYGIRDFNAFVSLSKEQYEAIEADGLVVRDTVNDVSCDPLSPPDLSKRLDVLMDVTSCNRAPIPAGSPGWKLDLKAAGAWAGEKVLSDAVTFQNIVYLTSYEPGPSVDVCAPPVGVNRLYEVSAATGATKLYWDNPTLPDQGVREPPTELRQGGIAPSVVFVFPQGEAGKRNPDPECLAGLAECGEGAKSRPVRTYWRERGAQ